MKMLIQVKVVLMLSSREYHGLFKRCALGEYCPLARSVYQTRLCPENSYCLTPEVLLPNECPCEVEYDKDHHVTGRHWYVSHRHVAQPLTLQ